MADLERRFPNRGTEQAIRQWLADKKKLDIGKEVTGEVVADMGNLIWLDIGVSRPAHLNREDTCEGPPRMKDNPPIGTKLVCRISQIGDSFIAVTQREIIDR